MEQPSDPTRLPLDRESVAKLLMDQRAVIRRRLSRMIPGSARALFDTDEVFSTICRRLDQMMASGHVEFRSEDGPLRMAQVVGRRIVASRWRDWVTWLRHRERPALRPRPFDDSDAAPLPEDSEHAPVLGALQVLSSQDHALLQARLAGASWEQVSHMLGITSGTARQRLQAIRLKLLSAMTTPTSPPRADRGPPEAAG
ncbi:MAG: sigma-70 family RNA polymerase sigma factor [Phycisphaerae bacterium]|nr:sigma-70 family RNA polymerase sigma factor [Phycisphaerae bacterium]